MKKECVWPLSVLKMLMLRKDIPTQTSLFSSETSPPRRFFVCFLNVGLFRLTSHKDYEAMNINKPYEKQYKWIKKGGNRIGNEKQCD